MSEPSPRPRRPNRVWRWTWRICATLFTLTFLVLLACSFDETPLDTSALRYEPRQIPDSENGYLVLASVSEKIGSAPDFQHDHKALQAALDGSAWENDQVAAWLTDRDFAIDAIRELSAFSAAQYPLPADIEAAFSARPYLQHPGWLAALRARQLQRAGDTSSATDLVLDCLHAARLLEHGRGDRVAFFQAHSMQSAAWDVAILLIVDPATSPSDCRRLSEAFTRARPDRDAFEQLAAAEFRTNTLLAKALENPAKNLPNWRYPPVEAFSYRLPFLYKPNETLNYLVPHFQSLAAGIDFPIAEREARLPSGHDSLGFLCEQYDDWVNRLGKRLAHDGFTTNLSGQLDQRLGAQTRLSLGQALIALRHHHDDHAGALPATLEELVPAYLPAAPSDYYTGEPLRYSKDFRALWSAGKKNLRLEQACEPVAAEELIVALNFGGSYAPWPRIDPYARAFFAGSDETPAPPSEHNTASEP